jgi:hypothetical protein
MSGGGGGGGVSSNSSSNGFKFYRGDIKIVLDVAKNNNFEIRYSSGGTQKLPPFYGTQNYITVLRRALC